MVIGYIFANQLVVTKKFKKLGYFNSLNFLISEMSISNHVKLERIKVPGLIGTMEEIGQWV